MLLASGAKAFDIGEAVLLGLATDRSDYPEITIPVTVKADLYGTAAADIEFFLDGNSIKSDSVNLSGTGSYSFAILPSTVTPGLHTLKAVLTVNGLTSTREVRFTYGSSLPDLVVRLSSAEPKGSLLPLTATATNQGKNPSAATTLVIFDGNPTQGGVPFATLAVPPLAGGASVTVLHDWPLLGKAGDHTLFAQVDPENLVVEFVEANNSAIHSVSIPNLTLGVTTGGSFKANTDVGIAVDLANLGTAPYRDLTLKLEISGPGGPAGSSQTAVAVLDQNAEITVSSNWNTGTNPPGSYRVEAALVGGGSQLASGSASFAVESTPSVAGTLALGNSELIQGSKLAFDYTLTNNGNVELPGCETKLEVVDRNSGATVQIFTQPVGPLSLLQTISRSFTCEALDVPAGDYVVKLTAQAAGAAFPIDEKPLRVLPALEVGKQLSRSPRVLVFIGKEEGNKALIQTESTIRQALEGMGVTYSIARDEKEFTRGLRGGLFNGYLLAGRKPLSDHLDREVAERINSGDGLILANYGPLEDGKFRDIAGIEAAGSLPAKSRVLTLLASPVNGAGSGTISAKVEKLRINDGTAQVVAFVVEKGENYPALILHPYGEGKTVVFAFDPDVTLLQGAVGYVAPNGSEPLPAVPLPVELNVRSLGGQFDLKIVETVDPLLAIIGTSPQGTVEPQAITWKRILGSNDSGMFSYMVGIPEEGGAFTLSSEISYLKNGSYEIYKTYPLIVKVDKGFVALKTDILVSLQTLAAAGDDGARLSKIIGAYAGIIGKPAFTEQQVDGVIRELLALTDDLRVLRLDSTAVRLDLDRLIRIYGRKWSLL